MLKINIPSGLAVILAVLAGFLQVLNQTTYGFAAPWHTLVTYVLVVLSAVGISPLVGTAFRQALANALHVSGTVFTILTVIAMAVTAALQTFTLDSTTYGILAGIVTVLAGLGFGPNAVAPPPPAPAA